MNICFILTQIQRFFKQNVENKTGIFTGLVENFSKLSTGLSIYGRGKEWWNLNLVKNVENCESIKFWEETYAYHTMIGRITKSWKSQDFFTNKTAVALTKRYGRLLRLLTYLTTQLPGYLATE